MVATIIAVRLGTAAVEIHIMLQFMLGLHLWLMSPDRLVKLEAMTTAALNSCWNVEKARPGHLFKKLSTDVAQREMTITRILFLLPMTSLNILSALQPPELSWSGVGWRMSTAAVIAAYNLAVWFDNSSSGAQQPPRQGCGPPYIFLL
ncbi:hypothetical protein N7537_011342 [Penicillium hordei]|uniref:Uncharacterized protein n=1 Tax=Penicillium hordei TaxID=40994 RepID=A0AAD6DLJ5_9EURO|nr:uncharacterized protein N7537_011342 [Penicillium hordei]KAJ5588664.1 hypothetical protein N7537_011342 [Penicillium hordei]